MLTESTLRQLIRQSLVETISNFITPQEETNTKQLKNSSTPTKLGDAIEDVSMNQKADDLGSDGNNAPTVSVKPGTSIGHGDSSGQKKAIFSNKTKQAIKK